MRHSGLRPPGCDCACPASRSRRPCCAHHWGGHRRRDRRCSTPEAGGCRVGACCPLTAPRRRICWRCRCGNSRAAACSPFTQGASGCGSSGCGRRRALRLPRPGSSLVGARVHGISVSRRSRFCSLRMEPDRAFQKPGLAVHVQTLVCLYRLATASTCRNVGLFFCGLVPSSVCRVVKRVVCTRRFVPFAMRFACYLRLWSSRN